MVVFDLFGVVSLPSVEIHFAEKSVGFFVSPVYLGVGGDVAFSSLWGGIDVVLASMAVGSRCDGSDEG